MGMRPRHVNAVRAITAIAGAFLLQLVLFVGAATAASGGGTFPMLLAR